MGNRAVITNKAKNFGIYVHWNGGRDSIEGFLEAARRLKYRTPEEDASYAFARLTGAILTSSTATTGTTASTSSATTGGSSGGTAKERLKTPSRTRPRRSTTRTGPRQSQTTS